MKPLPQMPRSADKVKRSSFPSSRLPQHIQSKSVVVVVLGVLYPSVLPQRGQTDARHTLVPPPLGIAGRQNAGVVFYDPLSPSRNGDQLPHIAKYWRNPGRDAHTDRAEARKAVARDLTLLSEKRRSMYGTASLAPAGGIPNRTQRGIQGQMMYAQPDGR